MQEPAQALCTPDCASPGMKRRAARFCLFLLENLLWAEKVINQMYPTKIEQVAKSCQMANAC